MEHEDRSEHDWERIGHADAHNGVYEPPELPGLFKTSTLGRALYVLSVILIAIFNFYLVVEGGMEIIDSILIFILISSGSWFTYRFMAFVNAVRVRKAIKKQRIAPYEKGHTQAMRELKHDIMR